MKHNLTNTTYRLVMTSLSMNINHNIFQLILQKIDNIHLKKHKDKFDKTLVSFKSAYTAVLNYDRHILYICGNKYTYLRDTEDGFNTGLIPQHLCAKCCYDPYDISQYFRYRSDLIRHQKSYQCFIRKFVRNSYALETVGLSSIMLLFTSITNSSV